MYIGGLSHYKISIYLTRRLIRFDVLYGTVQLVQMCRNPTISIFTRHFK